MKKKFLLSSMFCLVAFTLLLVSCGSDDDGSSGDYKNNMGQVSVLYGTAATYTYNANNNCYRAGHQEVDGTVLNNLTYGATFIAYLYDASKEEGITPDVTWQFETAQEVKAGSNLVVDKSHWGDGSFSNTGYWSKNSKIKGKAYVKSVQDNVVTIEFKDFVCDRISKFSAGSSTFQNLTINGEMKFKLEK